MSEQGDVLDQIEKEIYIAAEAEAVWALVSRPGWWINDDEVDPEPVLRTEGDVSMLSHPEWGDFAVRTVASDPPSYVAFRWLSGPSDDVHEEATLVEFWVERRPGGVVLRVVESGFAALSDDESVWRQQLDDNTEGWTNELKAARAFVTAHRG